MPFVINRCRAIIQKGELMDLISRQAAIDGKISIQRTNGVEIYSDEAVPIEYLKALPSAQPEPQWIPCSEPPKESGTYIVTAYDGTDKRVTFVKYQKTLKRWDLTGARAYWRILAYKPLPEPWRGEEHECMDV